MRARRLFVVGTWVGAAAGHAPENAALQTFLTEGRVNPLLQASVVTLNACFYAEWVRKREGGGGFPRALLRGLLRRLLRGLLRGLLGCAFLGGTTFGCHSPLVSLGLRRLRQERRCAVKNRRAGD